MQPQSNPPMIEKYAPGHHAFTLVEVLVVVAIIGVLASLLIVTLGTVQKRAATAKDISNLRQIGGAIQLHIADNNGLLPNTNLPIAGTKLSGGEADRWTFHEAVERYLGDRWQQNKSSIYNYLGNPIWWSSYAEPYLGFNPLPAYGKERPFAYGFNNYVNNSRWAGRVAMIPQPAKIVLMAEVNDRSSVSMTQPPATSGQQATGYRVNRSGGTSLYLFCDGHVETLQGDHSEAALLAAQKPNIWRWW